MIDKKMLEILVGIQAQLALINFTLATYAKAGMDKAEGKKFEYDYSDIAQDYVAILEKGLD